ncbi:MAG: DUF5808 domain-containing protein [Bacteroidota bacterium]
MNAKHKPDHDLYDTWHDDPSNWKLGLFYYNKLDKRIFPPKRIQGLGWTVNFANPRSYLFLLGLIVVFYLVGHFLF